MEFTWQWNCNIRRELLAINSIISVFWFHFYTGLSYGHRDLACSQYFSDSNFKHIWIDWQFQIFVQRSHTPIQLDITNSSSCEGLCVLIPTKPFSTKIITSTKKLPVPFYSDTPLVSVIHPDHLLPAKISTFSKEETSFPHGCASESSCIGELGSMTVKS